MTFLFTSDTLWEYQAASNTVPGDPTAVSVPATGYDLGYAPFGTLGDLITDRPITTAWPVDTGLWVRRAVEVDGLSPLLLSGRIEQAVLIYFDGNYVGGVNPTNSDREDVPDWYLVIPRSLASSGVHEIALWCFDDTGTGAGDTTYFYCQAEYLPAFLPLPPQAPVRETLEWKTDVLESFNGTEQALQVRGSPRQQFQYSFPANASETARAYNLVWGALPERWLVPLWTQATNIGAVSVDQASLSLDTTTSEYRASSLILLWESSDSWQILGVDTVGASSLVLVGLTQTFSNAWAIPLRLGRTKSNPIKKTSGYNAEHDLVFEIEDNQALSVAAPTQFLGEDIYFDESLMSSNFTSDNLIRRVEVLDEALGTVAYRSPWENTKVSRQHLTVAEGLSETWQLREWFHRRAGRYKPFWQPSFEADLRPVNTGTITDVLTVVSDEYLRRASNRIHLAIETTGGWLARTVTGTEQISADQVELTLDSAINVAASNILRVSYLGLKRLQTDKVEILWPGGGVARAQVRLLELNP